MKNQLTILLAIGLLLLSTTAYAQSVGIGTETPNSNAILELVAPNNNQGLLVPRMTTAERTAAAFTSNLSSADNGLMVYDEDENKFFFWIIDNWVELASGNLSGLPDQTDQSGKILSTDGSTSIWSELDFNNIANVPSGLNDGDDNTQLSDANIEAFGYVKTSDDADSDPTNEIQTLTAGTGIAINQTGDDYEISNNAPDLTVTLVDGGNGNVTIGGTYPNLSVDVPNNLDNDPSNENQTISAGTGISIIQSAEDFQVTNDAPDQTVILSDGGSGNVTIGGTYPNLSIDVADPSANEIAVSTTTDLSSTNVQDALEELQGEITTAASAGIVDGSVITSKIADLSVTNDKVSDVDFSKLTSVPAGLADGDDVNDADADPTNENQTVSAGTGISIAQTGDDFQVTNTSPDQTVTLADGGSGNVTVGGTYPNLTIDVTSVDDADSDPTNEDQTVSAGTGISISQTGDDFQVTNTSPDQTVTLSDGGSGNVTFSGTYPNLTIDVPDNNDNSSSNEIQDISTNGTAGNITISSGSTLTLNVNDADASTTNEVNTSMSLSGTTVQVTDAGGTEGVDIGGTFATDAELAAINESQWTTNGTSVNYTTGNVNIGAGTIPSSRLQLTTSNVSSTTPQLTIQESNSTSDASMSFQRSGTNLTMGIDATDGAFKMSGATTLGSNNRLIIDSQGTIGVNVTPNAQLHVQTNSIESTAIRSTNTTSGAGSKIGIFNELDNQGTSIKTGLWNDIDGTSGETGNVKGIYNIINPTDGSTYGMHTQINSIGSGLRYGTFNDVRAASGNTSFIYGFRANMDHDGTGDSYAFYGQLAGATTGDKYGVFMDGEDFNYFNGHLGIGEQSPDVELAIQSFDINSTLPLIRMTSGAATSDAAISFETGGLGNDFIIGVDATDDSFKISDASALGSNDRITVDNTGNVGISQASPSARLDVVGTTELNGAVDVQSSMDITGQLTVTNNIEIPATNDYTYASEQTRHLSYHPTEFQVLNVIVADEVLLTPLSINLYVFFSGGSGGQAFATAPVKLPNNAIVTQLDAWFVDNDAAEFTRVELIRNQIGTANFNQSLAQVETLAATESTAVTQLTDNTLFVNTIDNFTYSYYLKFTSSNGGNTELQLHGVRITYTVTQAD